jgi:thiaminase/transcriptional activator TenA
MLSYGLTGGLAEVLAAVFPCAWTYADYGKRLKEQYAATLENNFYRSWIETYASVEFSDSFEWFYDALDSLVSNMTEKQRKKIEEIFISSLEFEYLFWDMSYKQQMSY